MFSVEDEYEDFEKELREYLRKYEAYLSDIYTSCTVRKHIYVVGFCIEYLSGYGNVKSFDDIKFSHISSKFYYYFIGHTSEDMTRKTVFNIVMKFLQFIQESEEINPGLMQKIAKARI